MDNLKDFKDYALDHYKEFNAWPCEFETSSGEVWDADKCWDKLKELKLI